MPHNRRGFGVVTARLALVPPTPTPAEAVLAAVGRVEELRRDLALAEQEAKQAAATWSATKGYRVPLRVEAAKAEILRGVGR